MLHHIPFESKTSLPFVFRKLKTAKGAIFAPPHIGLKSKEAGTCQAHVALPVIFCQKYPIAVSIRFWPWTCGPLAYLIVQTDSRLTFILDSNQYLHFTKKGTLVKNHLTIAPVVLLRIQFKLNTALLSYCPFVCPSVCHRRDISHFSHI